MYIEKIETNFNKNIYLKTKEIKADKYKESIEKNVINVYPEVKYQEFIGFGGAVTQAVGIAYMRLPLEKRKNFLEAYFEGCNYNLCRIPIGSCDFSSEKYSYSYKKDLQDFNIDKDKEYIIPIIKDIQRIKKDVKFIASPWSPPSFMKSNKMLTLGGKLLKKYYDTYAKYLLKYIKSYQEIGINIDYITVQNEPNAMQMWESCLFNSDEELDFIKNYLYPIFKNNNINTEILIYDHNKEKMYSRAKEIIPSCDKEIAGIAYHWYTGDHFENIELCREQFKNKLFIHTEGCVGYTKFSQEEEIKNAEIYAHDIIGDLTCGCNGYVDWNILLDYNGGPNHKRNYCNSPIMLNKEENDYYRNLSYFYINQFARVIKPNAKRLAISRYTTNLEVIAFENTDKTIGLVILNKNNEKYEYNLCINDIKICDSLDSHSIVSYAINK